MEYVFLIFNKDYFKIIWFNLININMKKLFLLLFILFFPLITFAEQVEATNKAISNASPGDYIIRDNGEIVVLNQADIDYAKNQYLESGHSDNSSFYNFLFLLIIGIIFIVIIINLISRKKQGITQDNSQPNRQGITYIDENGYRRFSDTNKLVHRYVAEKTIGRKLRKEEIVHHINRNKLDNSPENLQVFPNQAEHEKHHEETDFLFKIKRRLFKRFRRRLFR